MDAVPAGEIGLLLADFRDSQIIIAEFCGKMGLVMAWKERGSLGYIAPLGETISPPLVVFRDWVVLGEVEGEEFRFHWMKACS
jgi:hypothetical protein